MRSGAISHIKVDRHSCSTLRSHRSLIVHARPKTSKKLLRIHLHTARALLLALLTPLFLYVAPLCTQKDVAKITQHGISLVCEPEISTVSKRALKPPAFIKRYSHSDEIRPPST